MSFRDRKHLRTAERPKTAIVSKPAEKDRPLLVALNGRREWITPADVPSFGGSTKHCPACISWKYTA